jgi:thiamine-phosphate pyrophosphorylase
MSDEKPRLYLVTPIVTDARAFLPSLEAALGAGDVASLLARFDPQSRNAEALAKTLAGPTQSRGTAFLVEGDPDFALALGADGLHVRGCGEELRAAIKRLSPKLIVGAGSLAERDDAMNAGEAGADYVTFGSFGPEKNPLDFPSLVERTSWWAQLFTTPCVSFAHSLAEAPVLAQAGADFVMLGDCVWSDPRGPAAAVKEALAKIGEPAA